MQREVDLDLPVVLLKSGQPQEHVVADEYPDNKRDDDDDHLHIIRRIQGTEKDRQLDIEDIVNTGLPGQYLQAQIGTGNVAEKSKQDTGKEGNLYRPPEILLKGHPHPGRYHICMQAVVPERIPVYPFQEMVPDNHWITWRRSAIWASTFAGIDVVGMEQRGNRDIVPDLLLLHLIEQVFPELDLGFELFPCPAPFLGNIGIYLGPPGEGEHCPVQDRT